MRARLISASSADLGETAPPDRPAIHLIWEAFLLLVAAVFVGIAAASTHFSGLSGLFAPVG